MKIIFMGTPDFAVPSLERLIREGYDVSLVVTRADQPKGRGNKVTAPPVKDVALSHGIPVYQPPGMKSDEAYERLAAEDADLIVVVAYGRILPARILQLPRYGCINIHGSLLPKYRGAAPVQWAVLNGDAVAGVTSMQMDEGMDTGDMLLCDKVAVPPDMTAGELFDTLAELGADVLAKTLTELTRGNLQSQKQDDAAATPAPMIRKEMSPLDFHKSAQTLHDQVRGLNPWPSATCVCNGNILKVHATAVGERVTGDPGEIVKVSPLTVACGDGVGLIIKELQAQGARRMPAEDYLRGHPVPVGMILT